eukprot:7066066-Alexandrium_andersonii.AAC.1
MYHVTRLRHIPGIQNTVADALSRQHAPEPKAFPTALASVPRALVPVCDSHFYDVLKRDQAKASLLRR